VSLTEQTPAQAALRASPTAAEAADVSLIGIRKTFGDVVAVDAVDLEIAPGEFFTMLGPSGSGKTTTLRIVAGFERPDSGRVLLRGQDVTGRPPYARDVNTVFQDYALFPHMTVFENVEYGLKVRGLKRSERRRRADEALGLVRLEGFGARKPVQLSGGQRQRVALARAIVNRPQVLLLDEPLGALDLKLRQDMQGFLKALQLELGITFLYVTHDQEEALTMSDRIAVFSQGRIEQVGTPEDVYERPSTEFVAGFVGISNLLERDGRRFTIRPEKIRILDADQGLPGARVERGRVRDVVYVGMMTRYVIELEAGGELVVIRQNLERSTAELLDDRGRTVALAWRPQHEYRVETTGRQEEE
jgi:putative spermidine/putrescine transport system ATP-binding protein